MSSIRSESAAGDPGDAFVLWPPPPVSEVDPFDFGVSTGANGPLGRNLNPYVSREVDAELGRTLAKDRAVVVSAPNGAGATRTVYEVLNRVLPRALLLVPRRPGEFDPGELLAVDLPRETVLWMDRLGSHWGPLGARLVAALGEWLSRKDRWFIGICYDGGPDFLASKDFAQLSMTVLRLESNLTRAELDSMRSVYGQVTTTAAIGYNPPSHQVVADDLPDFSNSIREVAASLRPAEVTASAFAEEIRKRHPEYAGDRFGSLSLNVDAGDQRPVGEWLSTIRARYDLKAVAESRHKVIDGRLALAALAAIDEPLSGQIDEATRAALNEECEVKPQEPPAREHVRWLADDPVGLDGDELGRRGVATALEQQLRAIVRDFPGRSFLVHIDGPWGAGKSTLLRFLRESVDRSTGPDRWLVVSYDAWRQSRVGPPWLTLLQAVRTAVRLARPHRWDRGWFWLRERARLVNSWQWIALSLIAVAATGLAILIVRGDTHLTLSNWGDIIKLVGGLLPVVGAFWLLAKSAGRFVSFDSRRSAGTFLETRADPMEDLAAHFQWVLRRARLPVLLLIDDLDRCPETFVVDLLDAVQKLMRDRKSDAGNRSDEPDPTLLVVVAADGRWIRNSYDNIYAALSRAVNEPGATVGTLFLEKLFQLTVPVPRLSDEVKADYLHDLLAERSATRAGRGPDPNLMRRLDEAPHGQLLDVLASAPTIERVKASQLAIEKLVIRPDAQQGTRHALEPYAALLDPTPRAMKRFVMAYSMLRAVRTAEGSVVGIGPLALWTILQTRWPLLANYLQASPEAVHLFKVSAGQIPGSTPVELVPVFTDPPGELRAVMNHPDGPMDEQTIRECSGQALGR